MLRRPISSSLPCSSPAYESPVWANVAECRKERKAAKSADQISHEVQISDFLCDICTIYIGRDFVEQDVYTLDLAAGSPIHLADNEYPQVFSSAKVFSICGGCAKRRHLPESRCVIHAHDWTRLEVAPGEYISVQSAEQLAQVLFQLKTRLLARQHTKAQERTKQHRQAKGSVEQAFNAIALRTLPKLPTLPSLSPSRLVVSQTA